MTPAIFSNSALRIHPFLIRKKKEWTLPQTQEEFEKLLDTLRPMAEKVEIIYQYGERKEEIGALIYCDGRLRHAIDVSRQNELAFKEEVESLVSFYKNPPRLWPGCRGAIARKFDMTMTLDFNRWFDKFANAGKGH